MKTFNDQAFLEDLSTAPWSVIEMFDNPNDALDTWMQIYSDILNKHAQVKNRRVKCIKQPEWLTDEIKQTIKMRDRSKQLHDMINYRQYRNKVVHLIRDAKKKYYTSKIEKNKGNTKEIWNCLKDINKVADTQIISKIKNIDTTYNKPKDIANALNNHFVNVAKQFNTTNNTDSFESVNLKLENYISTKIPHNVHFNIPPITLNFVKKNLSKINCSKSCGIDNLQGKFLKLAAQVISTSLLIIYNLSLKTGIFPEKWKQARVTPIFKSGDDTNCDNYRPISILPILSKILERHIHDHLYEYLTDYGLLLVSQSGFRKFHSCHTTLTKLVDSWLKAIDNGEMTGLLLVDFRKAFDLVDHDILMKKLTIYKFDDTALKWFQSYIDGRTQKVVVGAHMSDKQDVTSGVPQGSILGPLLFIIFINDLSLYTELCNIDLYADDTNLHVSDKDLNNIESKLNTDIQNIESWSKSNNMVIHPNKCKSILIKSKLKKIHTSTEKGTLNVKVGNDFVAQVKCEKVLGLHVDENLSWDEHAKNVIKKMSSNLYLLRRLKSYIPKKTRLLFYNSYILPHMDYCSTIWGSCCKNTHLQIVKMQKRAARLILNVPSDTQSSLMFKDLRWQTFPDRVNYHKAVLIYKSLNNLAPSYIKDLFQLNSEVHSYPLRSTNSNKLYMHKPKTEIFRKSLTYSGPAIWNSLPDDVRNANSLTLFKTRYMRFRPC